MPLDLDTPLDKTVTRIVRKVRVSRLKYEHESQRVSIQYEMLDAEGQVIAGEGLWFRLTDKDLFQKEATLKAFGDVQKLAYAHAQAKGLFGTGKVEA